MPELSVIYWRDIPSQVTATDGSRTARRQLDERFLKAIDAAAVKAGLVEADAYLEEWRRETRACADDVEAEVEAEVARLETSLDRVALLRLIRDEGVAGTP